MVSPAGAIDGTQGHVTDGHVETARDSMFLIERYSNYGAKDLVLLEALSKHCKN